MRTEAAEADRKQAVRRAAADWHRAGWIDATALRRIDECYPDDRARAGLAFRLLFFILTLCALQGGVGLLYALTDSTVRIRTFALVTGLACAGATEYLLGPAKRREGGIEAAVSVIALVQLMIAVGLLCSSAHVAFESRMALALFLFGGLALAAAWRWGYWFYAAAGTVLIFVSLSRLPWGRLLWVILPIALYRLLSTGCDTARLPPALRKSSAALLAVCVLAFYAAVNTFSLDHSTIETAVWSKHPILTLLPRWLSITLTAAVPPGVLILGIRTRRRLLLNLGLVLVVASVITLRYYAHVAPLWLALCGAGAALFAASALLGRYLNSGAGKERRGITAEPLLENPNNRRALEMLASAAALTPRAHPALDRSEFQGGGGRFGGGGASGDF